MSSPTTDVARDWAHHPAVAIAGDPATQAGRLAMMAEMRMQAGVIADTGEASLAWLMQRDTTGDIAVLAAIAGNPNTPAPLLFKLAHTFPRQVVANPVLPLLLLEDVYAILKQSPNVALALLRSPALPLPVVRQLQSHPNTCVQSAAKFHVQTRGTDESEWEAVAQVEFSLSDFYTAPASFYRYHPNSVFLIPGVLPEWLLSALRENRNELIRYAASLTMPGEPLHFPSMRIQPYTDVANPNMRLVQENALYRRAKIARPSDEQRRAENRRTPLAQLAELARHPDDLIRWYVARNPACDLAILRLLAGDPVPEVREMVLYHPRLPLAWAHAICANLLAMDLPITSTFYRVLAFASPVLSPRVLLNHVGAPDWRERFALARNPRTPDLALAELADDGVGLVRAAARAQAQERLLRTLNTTLTRWLPPTQGRA